MRRAFTLALLTVLLRALLPAAPATAQDWDPCADTLNGIAPRGYEIVWGAGGSGKQVVLGTDDDDALSGGSGDDILCGFGGDDVLNGGSGADWLDAGTGSNALHGGSGADTLIGMEGDVFAGGSGDNTVIANTPPPPPRTVILTWDAVAGNPNVCAARVNVTGFEPGMYDVVLFDLILLSSALTVDASGTGSTLVSPVNTTKGDTWFLSVDCIGSGPSTASC